MGDRQLLIIGDFACTSGFAVVNAALAARFRAAGWNVAVLAINYLGDPHPLQQDYALYPAALGGDLYGVKRLPQLVAHVQPDCILAVNDPQIVCAYLAQLDPADRGRLVGYVPVDGIGLRPDHVRPLAEAGAICAYTQFGAEELRRAGLSHVVAVVPHAVDPSCFFPVEQAAARRHIRADPAAFLVLMADRNTHRKCVDLGLLAFARFAQDKPQSVLLYYHGAVLDEGPDLRHTADLYGIRERFRYNPQVRPGRGVPADQLRYLYSAADVYLSATSGEGWGLTAHEALACGCPCVLPDFAAYAEWVSGGALLVGNGLLRPRGTHGGLGMQPDVAGLTAALERLYQDAALRRQLGALGPATAGQFSWDASAAQLISVCTRVAHARQETQ